MNPPVGFVVARDLGDGRIEWWEARPDGTATLHATAEEARAERDRFGADPDEWTVYALTEVQP